MIKSVNELTLAAKAISRALEEPVETSDDWIRVGRALARLDRAIDAVGNVK